MSEDELRWLLMEKRRAARQERIDSYRRTGRVIVVSPEAVNPPSLGSWRTGPLETDEEAGSPRARRKRLLNGFLLVVEVAAVLGFVLILFNGLNVIQQLNSEVVSALEQPTLTPTPLIEAVVLPSGHTPPNAPGGAQPNEAEIPAHLRPMVQSFAVLPVPTQGPEQAVRLKIPAANVEDAPIVQGDGWEQLKKGVGQHLGTTNPGQKGNLVLSAHNDVFGEIFRHIHELKPGDEVIVYTMQRAYTYVVAGRRIVEPTEVDALAQTDEAMVTLITCYPYLVDTHRVVVTAQLK